MSFHNFDEEDTMREVRNIDKEVLLLWGSEDKIRPVDTAETFHAALRNGHLALIRNAGHILQEEKPEKLLAAILEFIPALMP